jgi:ribosomal protein S18 acetylase RimI-like enzyme
LQIYQNPFGEIEGVGYIGKKNFFYTTTYEALAYFTEIISKQPKGSLILCGEEIYDKFSRLIALYNREVGTFCLENLMISSKNHQDLPKTNFLRFANENDYQLILKANAEIIHLERGYNPLETQKKDFEESIANLIKKRKSMIWRENDDLVCKVDIGVITPKVVYLEGIFVSPNYRGKGVGFQCIQEVKNMFMKNGVSLSLLVKNENHSAVNLYKKLDFTNYCKFNFAYLSS